MVSLRGNAYMALSVEIVNRCDWFQFSMTGSIRAYQITFPSTNSKHQSEPKFLYCEVTEIIDSDKLRHASLTHYSCKLIIINRQCLRATYTRHWKSQNLISNLALLGSDYSIWIMPSVFQWASTIILRYLLLSIPLTLPENHEVSITHTRDLFVTIWFCKFDFEEVERSFVDEECNN